MIISGIYVISHISSKQQYVGSSVNIRRRWWGHRRDLNKNTHRCAHLQNAWNKYGASQFTFEIVETVDLKDLDDLGKRTLLLAREQEWMDNLHKIQKLYNSCLKAGSPLGTKLTLEQRAKISIGNKGKVVSAESKALMSKSGKERIRSEAEIKGWSQNRTGTKQSEEHKAMKVKAQKATWALKSQEEKDASRKKAAITSGTMVDINGTTYLSYKNASRILRIDPRTLKKLYPKISPTVF